MVNIDFEKIINSIDIAILVVNFDNKIMYSNKCFCDLFNTNCENIFGQTVFDYLPENNTTIVIKDKTYQIQKTDETEYYFLFLNVLDNQLEKVYSDFISTVSHELRTPLTSIRGFADTMMMSYNRLDENQIKKFLNIIKEQSNRLIKLVENLLSISRIQVQQSNLVFKSINPVSQVEQIVDVVKSQYSKRLFEINCASDVSNVLVDENKFQQILINLLENAAKYSYENGLIVVSVENSLKKENFVSIKIKDNGVGIDKENQAKIFEKFARIENHLTRRTEGSGLGLYIVKNLVDKMGGYIFLESSTELPHSGSVFEVLLPAVSYTNQSRKILEDK